MHYKDEGKTFLSFNLPDRNKKKFHAVLDGFDKHFVVKRNIIFNQLIQFEPELTLQIAIGKIRLSESIKVPQSLLVIYALIDTVTATY